MNIHHFPGELAQKIGLAVLTGLLTILIFPKFNLEVLAWIAFIPLCLAVQNENVKRTFWLSWLAGFVHFMGTLYWVVVTMVLYGNISQWFSVLLLLLMAIYLALYFSLFSLIIRYLSRHTALPLIVTAPVVWVGLEYLRSFFFLPFPWNFLGYSQFLTPAVTQIADTTGVYGVSFLIMLVNAALYTLFFTEQSRRFKVSSAAVMLLCLGWTLGYGHFVLSAADDAPSPETVNIAVIQGNVDQRIKWEDSYRDKILRRYKRLSQESLTKQPDMVVWPETSIPFAYNFDPANRHKLTNFVRQSETPFLVGGLDFVVVDPPVNYHTYNTAFFLSRDGKLRAKYDKIQLVPFGEYVPFEKILFFVEKITSAVGKVQSGSTYTVMELQGIPFSVVICFEVIFPNLVRKFVDREARFLITITNDAWFMKTAASYQHFAMAAFRAIENRIAVARSANTGISGFIDPCGRILDQSEIFVEDALVREIPLRTQKTYYTQYGDVFAGLCFLLTGLWPVYAFIILKRRT